MVYMMRYCASGFFVQGDYTGATEAEVMLQGMGDAIDLSLISRAAQLVRKLKTLCQTCGSERMPL